MILAMPACPLQATTIKNILSDYATSIGLKINFHKSTLLPINCDETLYTNLANIFGCVVGKMHFTYLGLPLGTTKPTIHDLMPLVCRLERRLSTTLNMISYGGKLSLLNSVITLLLIYAMCTLKLPAGIVELLDKIRRKCLWTKKTDQGDKCTSLAAWDMVCKPKKCGGLGVLNLKIQNEALLLKFLHKFYNHWDLPWVELIRNTYYTSKKPHAADPCGSFWWRDVMQLSDVFRGITRVILRNGSSSLFWKDAWFDSNRDAPLMELFPRAFSFYLNEDEFVVNVLTATDPGMLFHLPLSAQAREEVREIQRGSMHVDTSPTYL